MKNPGNPHESKLILGMLDAPLAEQGRAIASLGLGAFAVQFFRNPCEGGCQFCANPDMAASERTPWSEIEGHLTEGHGLDLLCLAGNEPLLHPDFERAARRAGEVGFGRIQLMTSGLSLAAPGAARRLREWGVTELAIPVYSTHAGVHDGVFGGPAHARLVRALDNAAEAGLRLHLHTLALRANLRELPDLAEWVKRRWGVPLTIAMTRAKPGVFEYERLAPTLDQIAARLTGESPLLLGFPSCVLERVGGRIAAPPETAEIVAFYFRLQTTVYARTCEPCSVKTSCPGVVNGYAEAYGEEGLTAVA